MATSVSETLLARPATASDVPAVTAIYNEGIADRVATFETQPRTPEQVAGRITGRYPVVVVVNKVGQIVAWASTSSYRDRDCYSGIAEFSVYVGRVHRGQGAGRVALAALLEIAETAGFWKLLSRIFVENTPSRKLCSSLGFSEVGIYRRHAKLDDTWRDVVIVERLLGEAADA
ncbi:arsinothricin resistance N-acetyltransferase ArsN1 family A [Acidisoma sp. S159]|uniref:arsinothricin resistance N-acetyltransferase ArsN1 family A n=1 Tax=Acidisoma sp. S159 TaxID=1747225 RepID=UPI00131AE803|nr:arsinothricin resistance N-acetyltransferase ArsN1 family A [Acidisoma sp. S159]